MRLFVGLMVLVVVTLSHAQVTYDSRGRVEERKVTQGNTTFNQSYDGSYTRTVVEGNVATTYDSRGYIKSQETLYGGSVVNRDSSGKVIPPKVK